MQFLVQKNNKQKKEVKETEQTHNQLKNSLPRANLWALKNGWRLGRVDRE